MILKRKERSNYVPTTITDSIREIKACWAGVADCPPDKGTTYGTRQEVSLTDVQEVHGGNRDGGVASTAESHRPLPKPSCWHLAGTVRGGHYCSR